MKIKLMLLAALFFSLGSCDLTDDTSTCSDGLQNQGETGVDCGGPCPECHDIIDLSLEFTESNATPFGLAFDGQNFWASNNYQGIGTNPIYRYDKSTKLMSGKIYSPSQWPRDLTWSGNHLWFDDYVNDQVQIFKVSSDGTVISNFPAILSGLNYQPTGLAFDGQYLYQAETINGTNTISLIYKLDPENGNLVDTVYSTNQRRISGIAYNENSLWILSSVFADFPGPVYKLVNISMEGEELSVIDLFDGFSNVSGLAIAGGSFWTVSITEKIVELKPL